MRSDRVLAYALALGPALGGVVATLWQAYEAGMFYRACYAESLGAANDFESMMSAMYCDAMLEVGVDVQIAAVVLSLLTVLGLLPWAIIACLSYLGVKREMPRLVLAAGWVGIVVSIFTAVAELSIGMGGVTLLVTLVSVAGCMLAIRLETSELDRNVMRLGYASLVGAAVMTLTTFAILPFIGMAAIVYLAIGLAPILTALWPVSPRRRPDLDW